MGSITTKPQAASLGSQDQLAMLTALVTAPAPSSLLSPTLTLFPIKQPLIRHLE